MMSTFYRIQQGPCGKYTAEAIFFLFKIAEAMLDPSVRLYIYHTVCVTEFHDDQLICHEANQNRSKELEIQTLSANYIMAYKILLNSPVIILGLFCGAWSDRVGRKKPMLIAFTGSIFAVLLFMVSCFDGVPVLPFILCGAALRGMFGKSAVVTMGLHSYIADISTKEERTARLGRLLGMNFLGYFVGSLLTGLMTQYLSYSLIFGCVIFIYTICVILALACMRDIIPDTTENVSSKVQNPFHPKHVKESISVIFRPRLVHDRLYIWFFFFCIISQQLTKSGEVDITLLFTKRDPLNWNHGLYGYFLAVDYVALSFSVLVLLPILVYRFKPNDLILITFGMSFKGIRMLVMASANETWLVFISVIIGCPSGMIVSSGKSLISKLVQEDEIGKVLSLLSCMESVANLIGTVIFTTIYTATASTIFQGFTFLLDAVFYFVVIGAILLIWRDMKKSSKYYLHKEVSSAKSSGSTITDSARTSAKLDEGEENNGFIMPIEVSDTKARNENEAKSKQCEIFTITNPILKSTSKLQPLAEEKDSCLDDQNLREVQSVD